MAEPTIDLTDAEKRDLIALIQAGRPLPDKYRFLLFEDKREVELVWNGKTRDVCTTVLPFQTLEHVDEPRAEAASSPQAELFDARGRQTKGWTNKLIWGDNKLILSSLKSGPLREQIEAAGGLKLIDIDPPFDVGADFSMDIEIGGETFHKEPNILEQIAYRDTWGRGADSFIAMIYERLSLMRDLLAEDGGRLNAAQKEREFRELILRAYKAQPLPDDAASFFHGTHNGRLVVVGPINLPVGRLFVEEVITECRKRQASRVDVLAFEFEMGLFPAVLDEARGKGIELTTKQIPPEVFDKRAVERGQVAFHDMAFIEAVAHPDSADRASLCVELTDFSVYYTQGAMDAVLAHLRDGKSQVVCDGGPLWKVAKSKAGDISRDRLTTRWTDWIDDWAVDFDYGSRPEIIKRPKGHELIANPVWPERGETVEWEEVKTGGFIFENEWQSFRTRQDRSLELTTARHTYARAGRYQVAVKVIDIFGNDTMTLLPVSVG